MSARDEVRRARRAFIAAAHPDRGGDPEHFRAGLDRFDRLLGGRERRAEDTPRVFVHHRSRGLRGLLARLAERRRRRKAPPRVR